MSLDAGNLAGAAKENEMARVKLPKMGQPFREARRGNQTEAEKRASLTAQDYVAMPILKSPKKEAALVNFCMDRLKLANEERKRRIERLRDIDIQLSGFVSRTNKDDRKRAKDNAAGKSPKPTDHNLPLAQAQIAECVTYLMGVFAPESAIFESIAPANLQQMAQALTARINRDGQKGQYYRQLAKFCLNAAKYNIAALTCDYEEYQGFIYKNAGGQAKKQVGTIWQGNAIKSVSMYNFLYDITVHPVDLPSKGEYFADVERVTPFRVKKMAMDKKLFGTGRYIDESFVTGGSSNSTGFGFYEEPPSVRDPASAMSGATDWRTVFRGGEVKESTPGIELVNYTTWIVPAEHGLADSKDMELWRLVIANGKYLTLAVRLEDAHGMLPVVCTAPLEDDLNNEQRTYAEQLLPLQHFSSFLLNSHQAAVRKSIGGITIYNPHVIAGMDLSRDDLIGARIAIKSTATDFDIDKAFRHYNDSANTERHVEMLGHVDAVMQKILPTDTLKQVASLERATLYQAAATVQAGDRRNYTIACIVSDQALTPLKLMMIYNIYSKLTSLPYIDVNGAQSEIQIGAMVEAEIEHFIGTGLKGLDRLMMLQIYRDIVTMVIQSQQAIEEIDIVKLLNYFATLAGDRTDLNQFKRAAADIEKIRAAKNGGTTASNPGTVPGMPGGGPTQGG